MSNQDFKVVIPARYSSTRLPGKMLELVNGKPIIYYTYQRAVESGAEEIIIATDDERIKNVCESFGATVQMTSSDHVSGTSRLVEVIEKLNWSDGAIIVNVQGDEPLMPPELIRLLGTSHTPHINNITTLCTPIYSPTELSNQNDVKVVTNANDEALYFSRSPIPWNNTNDLTLCKKHLGIYVYSVSYLKHYNELPQCELEQNEQLEQLRALWNGASIRMLTVDGFFSVGIDTREDLELFRNFIEEKTND